MTKWISETNMFQNRVIEFIDEFYANKYEEWYHILYICFIYYVCVLYIKIEGRKYNGDDDDDGRITQWYDRINY